METTTNAATVQAEKISVTTPEFVAWLAACQDMIDTRLRATGSREVYKDSIHTKLLIAEQGSKFIRVLTLDGQRMAWCFVAREDSHTKFLGDVKRGDIHKCATWKAPSKHARGSIFQGGTGGITRWTGPDYIR
jgi:hypothetical protein